MAFDVEQGYLFEASKAIVVDHWRPSITFSESLRLDLYGK